jgi:hypothetical protein
MPDADGKEVLAVVLDTLQAVIGESLFFISMEFARDQEARRQSEMRIHERFLGIFLYFNFRLANFLIF